MRVLLVDDDAEFRGMVRELLVRWPEVEIVAETADGEEAVRLADLHRPDVVLMDLMIRRMNGLEATRRLKALAPAVAVIILTVYDDEAYRLTALAAGAEAFLEKKALGVDLWPTIQRIVAKSP
jgi:DNA-binding NarL/FixJ family response regulator